MSGGTEQQQNCRCGRLSDEAKRYITEARDTQIWLYLEIGIICCCIAFYLLIFYFNQYIPSRHLSYCLACKYGYHLVQLFFLFGQGEEGNSYRFLKLVTRRNSRTLS